VIVVVVLAVIVVIIIIVLRKKRKSVSTSDEGKNAEPTGDKPVVKGGEKEVEMSQFVKQDHSSCKVIALETEVADKEKSVYDELENENAGKEKSVYVEPEYGNTHPKPNDI
jgi:type III secretory pathway component EscV